MASEYVDLVSQVNGVLPQTNGGTGNQLGFAPATYIVDRNNSGSSFPLRSTVIYDSNGNLVLTTTDNQIPVAGVVIGLLQANGQILSADVPNGANTVVQTGGLTIVLLESHDGLRGYGDYIYTSSASPGYTYGVSTRSAGAIGVLLTPGTASPGPAFINLWSGASIGGPQIVTQEGVSVNPQTDGTDYSSVLPAHAYLGKTAVDIAPELLGGLVGTQIAYAYGATGTTTVRPTSDQYKVPSILYSSGSTGWNLVNGTSPGASYYQLNASPATIEHGYAASGLDLTYRIDSLHFYAYRTSILASGNTRISCRDPSTGQVLSLGDFAPGTGYIDWNFTTRPWDSRPWTLNDLNALQMGVLGPGTGGSALVYQVYIDVGWTKITSVSDELATLVGGIWRPLLASDGTNITAGAGGEAIMGFGPP